MITFDEFRSQVWRLADRRIANAIEASGPITDAERVECLRLAALEWAYGSNPHLPETSGMDFTDGLAAINHNVMPLKIRSVLMDLANPATPPDAARSALHDLIGDRSPADLERERHLEQIRREAFEAGVKHARGERHPEPAPEPRPLPKPAPSIQVPPALWPVVVEDFLAKKPGITPKTRKQYVASLSDLEIHLKGKPLREICQRDLQHYIDHLETRPNARGGILHRDSIKRIMSNIRSFIEYCIRMDVVPDINLDRLHIRDKTAEEKSTIPRRPFDESELASIFNSPLFTGYESYPLRYKPGVLTERQGDFWFFIVMATTGARPGELAYAPAKLVKLGDVLCIDVRHATKTMQSKRLIPILPDLEKVGFVDYARSMERRGSLLLPIPPSNQKAAKDIPGAWSKRLNKYLDDIGLDGEDIVGYSFRHACRQMLRAGAVGDELMNKVFGHADGRMGSGYGQKNGLSAQEARTVYDNVSCDLDLSHLHPARP